MGRSLAAMGLVWLVAQDAAAAGRSRPVAVPAGQAVAWAFDEDGTGLVAGTRLTGWVGSKKPADITVSVGNEVVASATADGTRYDVGAALGIGPDVGFDIDLGRLGFGTHYFCVRADIGRRVLDMGCHLRTVIPPRDRGPRRALVISGAGDVYTNRDWFPRSDGLTDFSPLLDGLGGLFLEHDVTVVNMDCTVSRKGKPVFKRYNLRCPVRSLRELKREGVDVISQGNNHAIDFGVRAMLDSAANIRAAGMLPVGSGRTAAEALTPQLIEAHGWRVAVFGLAQFVEFEYWFATENGPGVADGHRLGPVAAAIAAYDEVVDIVVVTVHWGIERSFRLSWPQTNGARVMVDAGADLILGHHPHRVQAFQSIDGVPVFYSLGNFVWFDLGGAASDSSVAEVVFRRSGKVKACLLDARIDRPGSVLLGAGRRCITTTR